MASTTFAMSYRKLRAIYAAKKRRRSVSLQNSEEYDSVSTRWDWEGMEECACG